MSETIAAFDKMIRQLVIYRFFWGSGGVLPRYELAKQRNDCFFLIGPKQEIHPVMKRPRR